MSSLEDIAQQLAEEGDSLRWLYHALMGHKEGHHYSPERYTAYIDVIIAKINDLKKELDS